LGEKAGKEDLGWQWKLSVSRRDEGNARDSPEGKKKKKGGQSVFFLYYCELKRDRREKEQVNVVRGEGARF